MERRIKKFSETINESKSRGADILEIVKKLGFGSLEEIKKEKAILIKLEALFKELPKHADVSEDAVEDIEANLKKKGEEKSLANKAGEKEEDGVVGGDNDVEVAEDAAEDIEDEVKVKGEPEKVADEEGEELVTTDQEVAGKVPDSPEDTSDATVIPRSRIMSFEEFIKESEETVNKNISYRDDEEEEDDALPVADGKDNSEFASIEDEEKAAKLKEDAAEDIEARANPLSITKELDDDGELVTKHQEIVIKPEDSTDDSDIQGTVVVSEAMLKEADIKTDADFEEYANAVLMKAHPDDFDEKVANKVIADLKKKYKDDYGAMIGALSSGKQ